MRSLRSLTFLFLLIFSNCRNTDDNVVARLDGKIIMQSEIDSIISSDIYNRRIKAINNIIDSEIIKMEAKRLNISVDSFIKLYFYSNDVTVDENKAQKINNGKFAWLPVPEILLTDLVDQQDP